MQLKNGDEFDKEVDVILERNIANVMQFVADKISVYSKNVSALILHNICTNMSRVFMSFCRDKLDKELYIKFKKEFSKEMNNIFDEFNNKGEDTFH